MIKLRCAPIAMILFLTTELVASASAASTPLYVALVEDARTPAVWSSGKPAERVIRRAFVKTDKGWTLDDGKNPVVKWTIVFDGKKLTEISQSSPASDLPAVDKPSERFGGWFEKLRRPLVAVSEPNINDPAGWKLVKPNKSTVKILHACFRKEFPTTSRCKAGELAENNWKYPDSRLEITRCHGRKRGDFLCEMRVTMPHAEDSCGLPEAPYVTQNFYFSDDGSCRKLGERMTLIDAGDYDADGKSELVFFSFQYNQDGYVIFSDDLKELSRLDWSYN